MKCYCIPTFVTVQVPNARVFDDFGRAALGQRGRRMVYWTIYTAILLNPVLLHLTSAEAILHSFPEARFHSTFAPVVVAILMAPLAQVSHSNEARERSLAQELLVRFI